MMKYVFLFILCAAMVASSSSQTVGTVSLNSELALEGYTLISPLNANSTYLINNCGEVIKEWSSQYPPGNEVFLDEQGRLWRAGRTSTENAIGAGGRGGAIEVFNWNGALEWSYTRCDSTECMHHDFKRLENGNLLILVWDKYTAEEAIAQGANPDSLDLEQGVWSEYLEEISVDLNVSNEASTVWQWHVWDHMVQDFDDSKPNYGQVNSPSKINLNYAQEVHPDWLHINAIDVNEELDQIILSVPHFDEFWIIDYDLTTDQAAGDQGDLIYRWGNPASYGQGTEEDQQLFFMHHVHWVEPGLNFEDKIILFNNRDQIDDAPISSVDVISPTLLEDGTYEMSANTFLPESAEYRYFLPEELESDKVSGVQVLENGNLLICSGVNATVIEIDQNEEIVWKYISPIDANNEPVTQGANLDAIQFRWLFRATKYTPDFEGFAGLNLTPIGYIETNSESSFCEPLSVSHTSGDRLKVFPNPAREVLNIKTDLGVAMVEIHTLLGNHILAQDTSLERISISHLNPGMYVLSITSHSGKVTQAKFIKN